MSQDPTRELDPIRALVPGRTLLEASAGTGKTHTITNLVLRMVAELGVPLPEILVVTFTRAATSELRDRVRGRLSEGVGALERAIADPDWEPDPTDVVLAHLVRSARTAGASAASLRLQRLVTAREQFDEATIATIHGFCQETLRYSAFESDVDLDAELVEDLDDLLEEIVHDTIVRELRHADPDWYAHLRAHGVDRSDLLSLARSIEAEPHLRVLPEDPLPEPVELWLDLVARFRAAWRDDGGRAAAWLRERSAAGALGRKKILNEELEETLADVDEWAHGVAARYKQVLGHAPDLAAGQLRDRTGEAYLDSPVFALFEEMCEIGGRPATAFKVRFASLVDEELARRKRQRNLLSFNDLLRALREGLRRPGTREALGDLLRRRFQAALIDEFQDTDPVQWAIFETVFADHGHLWLIGDPKQAIYAFRGADVHTYLAAAEDIDDRATLRENWRSDEPYVRALNGLFRAAGGDPGAEHGAGGEAIAGAFGHPDIPYIEVRAAPPNRRRRLLIPGDPSALEIVHITRELAHAEPGRKITKGWADRHLPAIVADEIVTFLRSGAVVAADDGERGVLPRDIAVLTRTNRQAHDLQSALSDLGVHAVASGGGSVFEAHEAVLLQRLFAGLLRPHVERDARAAVTTPLIGIDAPTLEEMPETDWERWIDRLATWSGVWRDQGVAEMSRRLFDEIGVRARVLALPGGERRLTNILHLLELLHTAERRDRSGPEALASWLRERRADPRRDREATEIRLESDEDAVTVVTVHRAKGLEYPVVWCPWLWEGDVVFPGRDRNLRLHDPRDGALSLDVEVDRDRPPKPEHIRVADRESWRESLRLLYVAVTRARHRCTVHWGALHGAGNSPLGWLLHGWDHGSPRDPALEDEELRRRLDELAGGSEDLISIRSASPPGSSARYEIPGGPGGELRARTFTRSLDRRWTRTSFTRLTRRGAFDPSREPASTRDVDAHTVPELHEVAAGAVPDATGVGVDEPEVPLARFPRGAAAGTFLHDVLERLDFTRAEEDGVLDELVRAQLGRHRLEVDDDVPVVEGLRAALRTPLGPLAGGGRLADIPPGDRLNELGFDLPLVGGYDAGTGDAVPLARIADVLERHAGGSGLLAAYVPALRELADRSGRGFLNGSIDLVFRRVVDGQLRYFVVDHKSNWHGARGTIRDADRSTVEHYHPAALASTMVHHHYVLQALIYLVGLHRLLRWRLGDSYDYDTDVGGVLYLFLRGMVGPGTPVAADGTPHGVVQLNPSRAVVEDLDQLFARGEVGR